MEQQDGGKKEPKQNKTLICKDCGREFIWTVGEQQFFEDKGLKNIPQRCKECREFPKVDEREKAEITCPICGKKDLMRFMPTNSEKVLCGSCFKENKIDTEPVENEKSTNLSPNNETKEIPKAE